MGQHLLDEVVEDVPVVAGEPVDEARDVVASLQRDGGELQGGDPALGAVLEGRDLLGCEPHPVASSRYAGGLVGAEPQVDGADLDQLAAHPPPRQRQVGVGPRAEHDVHVRREVVDQEGHTPGDLRVVDQVVVVEHQPDLVGHRGELVEQRGQRRVGRAGRGPQQLQRAGAEPRHGAVPGRSRPRSRTTPGRRGRRRATATRRAGRSVGGPSHEASRVVLPKPAGADTSVSRASPPSRSTQSRARHQAAAQARDVELGRHQRSCHVSSTNHRLVRP